MMRIIVSLVVVVFFSGCGRLFQPTFRDRSCAEKSSLGFPGRNPYPHKIELRRAYRDGYRSRWTANKLSRHQPDEGRQPHPGYSSEQKEAWRRGALLADLAELDVLIEQNQP